ncbi:MBL fold metallo-hydrolase [Virgisporangium ochraceum]|uniref:MBL fold metallo-hydrolase n=1 Tax=Virgisporangium ochraceum TaxID=65505 RepID=A0A8J4EHK7_9ACTN|nr:MBL fold metallo-hydrolase [Virgisporangium ochraceum]GIJ74831.1 MBL fold metallo-hydrolase [Virgisporangium ochraceum]
MSVKRLPPGDAHAIGDRVWAYVQPDGTWWVNNAGFILGDDGVVVVDTCATEERTRAFLAVVDAHTGATPVRWAVNTHTHGDHTYGNSLLPAATTIVGHEAMREHLLTDPIIEGCPPLWDPVPDWGDVERRVPSVTFRDALTLHPGGHRVEVRHPGHPAHTTGDAVVWLPDQRVLFSGDLLFHGLTPLVFMGSVTGAITALRWIADLDPAVVVPGHGPLIHGPDLARVLDEHERYYRLVIDLAERAMASGTPVLEAARAADLGPFADWADRERLVANMHRVVADARGEHLDPATALIDAVTYLGGPMPTSV